MRSALNSVSGERLKILTKLLQHTEKISILFYFGAIYYALHISGYFGLFAEHTRISEHALMPGLVLERFNKEGLLVQYTKDIRNTSNPQQIIQNVLKENGISCNEQKWALKSPGENKVGTNVYCIIRARRSSGTEAILLAAEMEHKEAVSLLLAYASFAKDQSYWARDLYIVFIDGRSLGMEAFLSQYHRIPNPVIHSNELVDVGGTFIGAVVIRSQKRSKKRESIKVHLNQLNGQLPNLDLFNSIVRIAGTGRFGLETIIYDVWDTNRGGSDWPLLIPLRALFTQAFIAIEGTHSVFGKYGIQGMSLAIPSSSSYSLAQSTRLVEAIARALNNVLERFHQSYFMYILVSESNFLSIAYYMPCMIVAAPLLFFAYREWVNMLNFQVPISWIFVHVYGGAVWMLSGYLYEQKLIMEIEWIGVLAALLFPIGLVIAGKEQCQSLQFLLYLESALSVMALSLTNFGLAFFSGLVAVPFLIKTARISENSSPLVFKIGLAILLHPITLIVIYKTTYGHYSQQKTLNQLTIEMATKLHQEEMIYGSHLRLLLEALAVPLWNLWLMVIAGRFTD